MTIAADLVCFIHGLLVCFMIWAPLFGDVQTLMLVEAGYLLLFLHWFLMNDACALTILEQTLRGGIDKTDSFIHSIVGPVYGISASASGRWVWAISLSLFVCGLYRLVSKTRLSSSVNL